MSISFRDQDPSSAARAPLYKELSQNQGAQSPLRIAAAVREAFRSAFSKLQHPGLRVLQKELQQLRRDYRRGLNKRTPSIPNVRRELLPYLHVERSDQLDALHARGELLSRIDDALASLEADIREDRKGGPRPDDRVLSVIVSLAEQFEVLTGLPVTRTVSPEGEQTSPFFRLVLQGFADFTDREEDPRGAIITGARSWSQLGWADY